MGQQVRLYFLDPSQSFVGLGGNVARTCRLVKILFESDFFIFKFLVIYCAEVGQHGLYSEEVGAVMLLLEKCYDKKWLSCQGNYFIEVPPCS